MSRYVSPRVTRRQTLGFLAGAAGGLALHGCARSSNVETLASATDLVPATMATTAWIGNSALYVADEKNFFRNAGLDLTIRTYSTVAESFPALSIGQVQAVSPVASEAVLLASEGIDYRIVAVMDTSSGADAILARNSVTDIADFRGRRVAVQRGGVGHFFLLQVLAEAGLTEQDITIVDTTPEAGVAAYEAGNVEIAYSYPPYIDSALVAQRDGRVIYDTSQMPTAILDFYAFTTNFIETQPDAVRAFVSSIFRAVDLIKTNDNSALSIAAKRLDVTASDLKTQLEGIDLPDLQTNQDMLANPDSDLYLVEPLTALAEFLVEQNQITEVPNMANFIDPQFVQNLSAEAST
ncbi:ABC transporter substrate-binding protein [Egbenema bharatensis]|uniref:ABC transporter substrate-binding protein n=1 Tax=Egbenema bharatensis TaxID=3463334 RepID=UPI003A8B5E28